MENTNDDLFAKISRDYARMLVENAKMKALLKTFKDQFKDGDKDLFVAMIDNLKIYGI